MKEILPLVIQSPVFLFLLHTGECLMLPNPANGTVIITGQMSGDTATYTCDSGHELDPTGVRTCQINGAWSGSDPQCIRKL